MKKIIAVIILVVIALLIFNRQEPVSDAPGNVATTTPSEAEAVKVIVENLKIPWDIAFLPGGDLLVTERPGILSRISKDGQKTEIPISGIKTGGEGGLLGLTLHPKFAENQWAYVYYGTPAGNGTINKVERYKLNGSTLSDKKVIIENIPGALYHDGGRIEFGPDGYLYITTGDATNENSAQDRNSLAGKILRLNDDGTIPADNPFGTAIYSYGHRNPQGLAWDDQGRLWSTEHGRSGVQSGLDELNNIEKGKNYGWPTIEGDETRSGMEKPALHSGANDTWAPASAQYYRGAIYFGGLRGEALYKATLNGSQVAKLEKFFHKEFGRIRTVRLGPDGLLYLTTSNTDGRGSIKAGDDKIIRINLDKLR